MARNVLIDTSAIYAIVSPSDRFHAEASELYSELLERGDRLHTTSYVLLESAALIQRRLGFDRLKMFIESIEGVWQMLWVYPGTHDQIWGRMKAEGNHRLSLVDWSLIVSAETTQSTIFSFDSDFIQRGLRVVPERAI